jgi:hypothetical protein
MAYILTEVLYLPELAQLNIPQAPLSQDILRINCQIGENNELIVRGEGEKIAKSCS